MSYHIPNDSEAAYHPWFDWHLIYRQTPLFHGEYRFCPSAYTPRTIVHLQSFAGSTMDIQLEVQWSVKVVSLHLRALH